MTHPHAVPRARVVLTYKAAEVANDEAGANLQRQGTAMASVLEMSGTVAPEKERSSSRRFPRWPTATRLFVTEVPTLRP